MILYISIQDNNLHRSNLGFKHWQFIWLSWWGRSSLHKIPHNNLFPFPLRSSWSKVYKVVFMAEAYLQLVNAYAEHIAPLIPVVAEEYCRGCQEDHPSQLHHDVCLLMEPEDCVTLCLGDAVSMLDEDKVMAVYHQRTMDCCHKPDAYNKESWRMELWEDQAWREHVTYEVCRHLWEDHIVHRNMAGPR